MHRKLGEVWICGYGDVLAGNRHTYRHAQHNILLPYRSAFSTLMLSVGSYLSGARCRFAYAQLMPMPITNLLLQ